MGCPVSRPCPVSRRAILSLQHAVVPIVAPQSRLTTHAAHAARPVVDFSPVRKSQLMTVTHLVIVLKFRASGPVLAGEAPRGFSEHGRCSVVLCGHHHHRDRTTASKTIDTFVQYVFVYPPWPPLCASLMPSDLRCHASWGWRYGSPMSVWVLELATV